ncbi:hypothetical protein [Glutamicibacter halophytocola]|uniref:hypothetical protein n=1 Tax=Glutamicibacter halophytocola TaxID=1933880 RepID=UPI0015C53F1E|nr:hypothetical protein [Glutamicibacter halophytocola]NQD40566.1 hypothetical protein [Glutamicibacter halophytocola]
MSSAQYTLKQFPESGPGIYRVSFNLIGTFTVDAGSLAEAEKIAGELLGLDNKVIHKFTHGNMSVVHE